MLVIGAYGADDLLDPSHGRAVLQVFGSRITACSAGALVTLS